jgi:hypothetical protein
MDELGGSSGFGAAAHIADEAGIAAVRKPVLTWSAAIRTRRVLLAKTEVIRNAPAAILVSSTRDIGALNGIDPHRVSYTVAPGIPVEAPATAAPRPLPAAHATG